MTSNTLSHNDSAASWSEMVKSIEQSKKTLPWNPSEFSPVQRVSLFERKRQERTFDPVSMQYTDPMKESMYQTAKSDRLQTISRKVLNNKINSFNFITHKGPPRKIDSLRDTLLETKKDSKTRKYQILSNLTLEDHNTVPLICNEEELYDKVKKGKINSFVPINKNREFNIVSNHYYKNHDDRKMEEYEQTRDHVVTRYWETHDFDPIKVEYYDKNKEETFLQQRDLLKSIQGSSLSSKIPSCMLYSEGNSYNILNNTIYDEEKLKATQTVHNLAMNRQVARSVEKKIKGEREERLELENNRKLNKVSYKRWENQIERGYDAVFNNLHSDNPNYHAPLPVRPVTMWAKLTSSSSTPLFTTTPLQADSTKPTGLTQSSSLIDLRPVNSQARNLSGAMRANTAAVETRDRPSMPLLSNRDQHSYQESYSYGSKNNNNNSNSALTSSRSQTSQSFRTTAMKSSIPSLDLKSTEQPEKVTYKEPSTGPLGMAVPMVRTGGLSAYRE